MESYKVKDDRTGKVLIEGDQNSGINFWEYAYEQIKAHPEYEVFIDVYEDGKFDHWCDPDSIVFDVEYFRKEREKENE